MATSKDTLKDPVVEIEYLPTELVGEHMDERNSIVDVRCKDARNRHFIVEMQISLHKAFLKRVLFNACKVYSRQLPVGSAFEDLKPVHCLCILNSSIDPDLPTHIQTYNFAKEDDPTVRIEGIHFHFLELSKFMKNATFDIEDPLQRWMKFFADPEYFSTMPIKHYETFEELKKAIEMLDESNFTEAQLYAYDKYLDNIRTQKAIEAYQKEVGLEEGRKIGRELGIKEGIEEGKKVGKQEGLDLTMAIIEQIKNGQLSYKAIAETYTIEEEKVMQIAALIKI